MRIRKASANGLAVRAVAGTHVVLLGFDIPANRRQGLLGFSIHRTDHTEDRSDWLRGMLYFPGLRDDAGDEAGTDRFPIQKFRWGDYTAKPRHDYTYRIETRYGQPGQLTTGDSEEVRVTSEDPNAVGGGGHQIHFNRSAAASQAYVRRFGDKDPRDVPDGAAFRWLSRGLEESLIAFIERAADAHYSLYLCIYEFQKDSFLEALCRAAARGAKVEVMFDAIRKSAGPRAKNLAAIKKNHLTTRCHPREGINAISHHKFMVLAKDNQPLAVWTGSTNFTDGAIYGQANVGHAVENAALAKKFLDLHQALLADPDLAASRQTAESLSPVPPAGNPPLYPIFSPRTNVIAIDTCKDLIDHAKDLVCFTAPFALHDELEDALDDPEDRFLKFGLLNNRANVVERVHRTKGNRIAAAAYLKTNLDEFQKESMHHKGVYIHTKYFLIDPLSENPKGVTGSANFSTNSSKNNDENQLILFGEKSVADVYLGEFMRLFDHYTFRDFMNRTKTKPKKRVLATDDSWTQKYFAGGREERDRAVFSS